MIDKILEELEQLRHPYMTFENKGQLDTIDYYINKAIEIVKKHANDGWHVVADGDFPECEKEVEITVERHYEDKVYIFTCRAIYEDGNMWREDSGYNWNNFDNVEYDEEKDDWKVPEGWFESVSYAEEFAVIDDFVIAWRELPPKYMPEESEVE